MTPSDERLQREVGRPREHQEPGVLRAMTSTAAAAAGRSDGVSRGGGYAVQLARVPAGELHAGDPRVPGQGHDDVGGYIDTVSAARIIVDDDGDWGGRGDRYEVSHDRLRRGREERGVVRRRQYERIVAPVIRRLAAEVDRLADALGAAPDNNRNVCEAGAI